MKKRIRRTKEFKFKVAIEAIKGQKQLSELAEEFGVHPKQISHWKNELLEKGSDIFSKNSKNQSKQNQETVESLYKKIGQQNIEIDWLKKIHGLSE